MQLQLLNPQESVHEIEAAWRQILAKIPGHSYFLSWGWMENWLATALAEEVRPRLCLLEQDGCPVLAFFVSTGRSLRHGFVPSRALFLNSAGRPELDQICIEFNAMARVPGAAVELAQLLPALPEPWDELVLPGLDAEAFPAASLATIPANYRLEVQRQPPAHYVDLARVRERGDYLCLLSSNTRSQIRRTRRLYCQRGELRLNPARSVEDAEATYDELLRLHRRMWELRGQQSNFDTRYVQAFHHRLIRRRFAAGEIQLLRLTVNGETVGCLYNLLYKGRAYAYQSGFRLEADNRLKPGLLCHSEAIESNAEAELQSYELLAGDGQYKSSLGTDSRRLLWCRVQKRRPQFWLERQARRLKRRWVAARLVASARTVLGGARRIVREEI